MIFWIMIVNVAFAGYVFGRNHELHIQQKKQEEADYWAVEKWLDSKPHHPNKSLKTYRGS